MFGFRYDTLEGHIERGVEWFLLTKNDRGDIRFRVVLSRYYQRKWHHRAHHRLSLLAHHGSTQRPRRDSTGLTHQGIGVTFTHHTNRRWFT